MSKIWDFFNRIFGGGTKGHTNIVWETGSPNGMTYEQAIEKAKDGFKIGRIDW